MSFVWWEGLSEREKLVTSATALLSVASLVVSIIASGISLPVTVVAALVSFLTSGICWSILGPRVQSYFRNTGWFCPRCGERVGMSDEAEAFLLRGALGDIPDSFEAYVVCSGGHSTQIPWAQAWNVMRNHLAGLYARARGKAAGYEQRTDPKFKPLLERERAFERKSYLLMSKGELMEYANAEPGGLLAGLKAFAHKSWPKRDREALYHLLAATESYARQIQNRGGA